MLRTQPVRRSQFVKMITICLLFLPSGTAIQRTAEAQETSTKHLSHRGFEKLIKKPVTAGDHLELADYYHRESLNLRKEAAEHAWLARAYASGKLFTPKSGIPNGEFEHCKGFAESLSKAADDAEALAVDQQNMAANLKE